MNKLIYILIFSFASLSLGSKSPHGKNFKLDCNQCHQPTGWVLKKNYTFNHDKTHFKLKGQHKAISCRTCHPTLVFSEATPDCAACHKDMHEGTVGRDCNRCHTTDSWIVKNVKQIHQQRGFALVGLHASADCNFCHKSASSLRFNNLNSECVSCHRQQYETAQISSPDLPQNKNTHRGFGFNTDCFKCHNMVGRDWSYSGRGFEHGFFPLVGGHKIECASCHWDGFNTKLSPNCSTCHEDKYNQAKAAVPAHNNPGKIGKYNCTQCHSAYGWNIVKFKQHPPYDEDDEHKNEACLGCHYNTYVFDYGCKRCHD